jgi:hypothetical protein
MTVSAALFRIYRLIIIPFASVLVLAELVAVTWIASVKQPDFSMWLVLAGSAEKYWLLVIGIILVSMNLRQFVANGVTRHEFLAGAAVFGLVLALGWSVALVLGHVVEALLLGAAGRRGDGYPGIGPLDLLEQFGHALPLALGWMLSGALIAAGFFRWRVWLGLIVMVGGAIPAAVADGLLAYDEFGTGVDRLPYPAALALSIAATAVGAVALHRAVSDTPIRRAAG